MAVARFAAQCGFDQSSISEITLAVGEACNTAIENSPPNSEFILACHYEDGTLTVEIESYRSPARTARSNGHVSESRGLGVLLMRKLVDSVEYDVAQNEGTKIILKKHKAVVARGT